MSIRDRRGCGFILLIDPDDIPFPEIEDRVRRAISLGVDIIFVGGSLLMSHNMDEVTRTIKKAAGEAPVIVFPGGPQQISGFADAILFISLISGRNPENLIGHQVMAAPIIHQLGLEAISCGYMLIESGNLTSVGFRSASLPIPRSKPKIALAHALAAQYLGMSSIYLEAGSGAELTVPDEMVALCAQFLDIPIIVGGGLRTPEEAGRKARAGADFVVIGNFFEADGAYERIRDFAEAIHRP